MLKRNKNKIIISSLVILGIVLILSSSLAGKKTDNSNEEYINSLETKIEEFLKEVDGIKEAKVIITLEEYDKESNEELFGDNSDTTSVPKVRGVAVACTNGDNYAVQEKITSLISSYLGIPSNRVKIVAIK